MANMESLYGEAIPDENAKELVGCEKEQPIEGLVKERLEKNGLFEQAKKEMHDFAEVVKERGILGGAGVLLVVGSAMVLSTELILFSNNPYIIEAVNILYADPEISSLLFMVSHAIAGIEPRDLAALSAASISFGKIMLDGFGGKHYEKQDEAMKKDIADLSESDPGIAEKLNKIKHNLIGG